MEKLVNAICNKVDELKVDVVKTDNKAAQARARKASLELEKLFKEFRKASVAATKK